MTFWIIIVLMLVLTLAFMIIPLLRQAPATGPDRKDINVAVHRQQLEELEIDLANNSLSQDQYQQAKLEIEKSLLHDIADENNSDTAAVADERWTITALVTLVPIIAVALYFSLGSFSAIDHRPSAVSTAGTDSALPSVESMVQKLAERLRTNPNDGTGWSMLGRSYTALGRYQEAAVAYEKARKILGDNPTLLSDQAEVLAVANNNQLAGKPRELIASALKIDPNHQKSLWLAGHAAAEAGERKLAAEYWTRLLQSMPADSDAAATVKQYLAHVQDGAALPGQAAPQDKNTSATGGGAEIKVAVALTKALGSKVSQDDTVFIFARAASGPKMPLAIVRKQVKDLPVTVTLNDSMAMMANMTLSKFEQVIVGARISKTGNAMAQPGDLQGLSQAVDPKTTKALSIQIDNVVQ